MDKDKTDKRVVVLGTGPIGKVADLCKRIEERNKKTTREEALKRVLDHAKGLDW